MNKVKQIIKDNIFWFAVLLILIIGIIGVFIYNSLKEEQIYNDPNLSEPDGIPYVNYTYEDNEYRVITMEKVDVYNAYYKDFIKKMVNDPKASWDYISEDEKNKRFHNKYEEYTAYIKDIVTKNSLNNNVEKYKVSGKTITVIDSANYMYEFKENGVWNFKVSFKGQVTQ